jgi:hypothetical protein
MPEYNLPDRSIHEPTTSALHPAFTMPQGTQRNGVETGHEHRDINVRAVINWFVLLGGFVAVTFALMWGMYLALNYFENRRDVMPSPLYATRIDPPAPRLLPNPVDSRANPNAPMEGPAEYGTRERERQRREAADLGFVDPVSGQGRIPERALTAAEKDGTPGVPPPVGSGTTETNTNGTVMPAPSYSSGGRKMENGLQ